MRSHAWCAALIAYDTLCRFRFYSATLMALSIEDVRRSARLARIAIEEDEAQSVLEQLVRIFAMIEEMRAVDVSGIEPMAHAQDLALRLREDVVTEPDQRELFQAIAPQVRAGLYLVPKVIE
jgi:aspartyl-tRNA(Asn)/glutamyl-tRNA(Gln) amidotransferase subunit C